MFKRYHSPFLFLDSLISCGQFIEGINTIYLQINEEKLWEMYLHSLPEVELSFEDWKNNLTYKTDAQEMNKKEVETAINKSQSLLKSFKPKG